jgi:hypothetical protein
VAYAEDFTPTAAGNYLAGSPAVSDQSPVLAKRRAASAKRAPEIDTRSLARHAPTYVRLPCMVFAAVGALTHAGTAALEPIMAETRKARGVLDLLTYAGGVYEPSQACRGGVAVIARGYWLARQSLDRLMDQCGVPRRVAAHVGRNEHHLSAPASLSGLTAESAACTAQFYNGHLRLWMPTSDPARVRATAARIAGIAPEAVDLRELGANESPDGLAVLVPAIALARHLQSAPVQLIVAYDLGVHCQIPALPSPARAPRQVPERDIGVALAA